MGQTGKRFCLAKDDQKRLHGKWLKKMCKGKMWIGRDGLQGSHEKQRALAET